MKQEGREKQAVAFKRKSSVNGRATPVHCKRKTPNVLATKTDLDFQISAVHKELYTILLKNSNLEITASHEKASLIIHLKLHRVLLASRLLPEDYFHHLGHFSTLV